MSAQPFKLTSAIGDTIFGYSHQVADPKGFIVITTGMEEPAERYHDYADFLLKANYSVFVLDHYGQGLTATENHLAYGLIPEDCFPKFVEALHELIIKLGSFRKPIYLIGHSMGSFVVQKYLQLHSDSITKAVLIGSNGKDLQYKLGNILAKLTVFDGNWDKKAKFFNKQAFGAYAKSVPAAETEFDWLSYNKENVQNYIANPACGYGSSKGFYHEFMRFLSKLHKKKSLVSIRKEIPILNIAGIDDPVGHHGKGVNKLTALYQKAGLKEVQEFLVPNMRHEILHENNKKLIYEDILSFLENGVLKYTTDDYQESEHEYATN